MVNKRGAELTIGTLVIIVLALIVLVVLALGFGAGWSNLWSKITGYFSPVNVDATKQACSFACTTNAQFDYCCRIREVRFEKGKDPTLMTCGTDAIKPEECDLSCNVKTDCKRILCAVGLYKPIAECETVDSGKLSPNGELIPKNAATICCKELKPQIT